MTIERAGYYASAMLRGASATAGVGVSAAVSGEKQQGAEVQPQVLVVDRHRDIVELLAYALGRAGIGLRAAHDAASALETFAAQQPPVVVLDPCGLDVFEQLRASGDDTAIIVLTAGDADDEARAAALQLGADDYLTKPFSCAEVVASVQACLLRGRQNTAYVARTGPPVAVGSSCPAWIRISRQFFKSHGGQVWTLDGQLPAELMVKGLWPLPDLLLEAQEYSAEARAYRDAAYQRALCAAWALALNSQPMEPARLRTLLDRETLIGALEPHRARDKRIQDWIERLQHQRTGVEESGARGLDRALSIFAATPASAL